MGMVIGIDAVSYTHLSSVVLGILGVMLGIWMSE